MGYRVRWTPEAQHDLHRLQDFLIDMALAHGGDWDLPSRALEAIVQAVRLLQTSPFSCRKAEQSPFLRELIIPFVASGYVALFEIADASQVIVVAVRHQRESDYH